MYIYYTSDQILSTFKCILFLSYFNIPAKYHYPLLQVIKLRLNKSKELPAIDQMTDMEQEWDVDNALSLDSLIGY